MAKKQNKLVSVIKQVRIRKSVLIALAVAVVGVGAVSTFASGPATRIEVRTQRPPTASLSVDVQPVCKAGDHAYYCGKKKHGLTIFKGKRKDGVARFSLKQRENLVAFKVEAFVFTSASGSWEKRGEESVPADGKKHVFYFPNHY